MGLVHFLHGNPNPLNTQTPIEVECPNCDRSLKGYTYKNAKKVCPFCEKPLPEDVIKKLDGKSKNNNETTTGKTKPNPPK